MAKLPTEPPEAVARMMGAYIIHHKGRAAFTFCIYLFASVMGAVVPLQIGAVVDEVVAGKYTEYPWKPLMIIFAATFAEAILMRMRIQLLVLLLLLIRIAMASVPSRLLRRR